MKGTERPPMPHFSLLSPNVNAGRLMTRSTEETLRLPAWPPSGKKHAGEDGGTSPSALPLLVY